MTNLTTTLSARIKTIALITLELQRTGVHAHTKPDQTLISQVDIFVQAALTHHLTELTPGVAILGEETPELLYTHDSVRKIVEGQLLTLGIREDSVSLLSKAGHTILQDEYWCLDPIDGTRGFLRGDHYAIALARIQRGRVVQSFLCCPRLRGHGVLFTGEAGQYEATCLASGRPIPHQAEGVKSSPILIESLELGPSSETLTLDLKAKLGWTLPNTRMDSQSKYGALTLGDAHCYLRPPHTPGVCEFSWDHAAGAHLVEMAGGQVTDLDGCVLDFSTGAKLHNNRGIVATMGVDHASVISSISHF
jgi:3'(2'), 5'-bisphosphate nucleotidase